MAVRHARGSGEFLSPVPPHKASGAEGILQSQQQLAMSTPHVRRKERAHATFFRAGSYQSHLAEGRAMMAFRSVLVEVPASRL
jgi:hypothetical protein